MTPQEQKLARRIHKQRIRLRQLEGFAAVPIARWRRWMDLALKLGRENRELKSKDLQKPEAK